MDIQRAGRGFSAAIVVISDSTSRGERVDRSGARIQERLEKEGAGSILFRVISDDPKGIEETLIHLAEQEKVDVVITTGGTGFGPRDNTPEAVLAVVERETPGIPEAIRAKGRKHTPLSMLSRSRAGIRGKTLIVSLPGSEKAVRESLDVLFPALIHAFSMMDGKGHG